jgi:hypothetical protein
MSRFGASSNYFVTLSLFFRSQMNSNSYNYFNIINSIKESLPPRILMISKVPEPLAPVLAREIDFGNAPIIER